MTVFIKWYCVDENQFLISLVQLIFLSQQRNNALNICELGYRECQKKKSVVTVSPCSCGYKARKHCRKQFFKFTIFSASGNVE